MSTQPGLKLALEFIDSKITTIDKLSDLIRADLYAQGRIDGAKMSLLQLRERIVRALGPDAE